MHAITAFMSCGILGRTVNTENKLATVVSVCVFCPSPVKPKTPTLSTTGSTTAVSGTNKVLTCTTTSTGVPFTYKFYKDGTTEVTSGVSGNELTLTNPTVTGSSAPYSCEVTATTSSAVSDKSSPVDIYFVGEFWREG